MVSYRKKELLFKKRGSVFFVLNQEKGEVVSLNETSFFLWQELKNTCTIDDLLKLLTKEYDINLVEAKQDIKDFLELSTKTGIVEKLK